MSSSDDDSEAFQSADEDVPEIPKAKQEKGVKQAKGENEDPKATIKHTRVEPNDKHELDKKIEVQNVKSKSSEESKTVENLIDDDADWGDDDWDTTNDTVNEAESGETKVAKKSKDDKPPAKLNDDNNWGDDVNWGDEWGEEETAQDTNIPKPIAKEKSAEKAKQELVDEMDKGGWDDDWEDGWGDSNDDPVQCKTAENSSNHSGNQHKTIGGMSNQPKEQRHPMNSQSEQDSWKGWKPWGGAVSLLSSVSGGVASFTQGLSSVIESGIGIPQPEELAKQQTVEKSKVAAENQGEKQHETKNIPSSNSRPALFDNIVNNVSNISSKVITGGLDTLEGIGKKTMDILQENDPLLMNKRRMLGLNNDGPVLSQVLREAKERSEEHEKNLKQIQKNNYKKTLHFETLFDDYHGLVHLEALEMLSKQSEIKLQNLMSSFSGKALAEIKETIEEVKELCDLSSTEIDESNGEHTHLELTEKLDLAIEDLDVPIKFDELITAWDKNCQSLNDLNSDTELDDVYKKAMHCLAESCSIAILKMHKIAELILIKDHHSTTNEVDSMIQLRNIFCWHLSGVAARYGDALGKCKQTDEANNLITNIFLEGSNSTSYINNSFQLFLPILQIGAI